MCLPRNRNIIDFVNGLGAIVVIIYHEQTIDTLGNDHCGRSLRRPGLQACGAC